MTTREFIIKHIDEWPREKVIGECAKRLKVKVKTVQNTFSKVTAAKGKPADKVASAHGGFSLKGKEVLSSRPTSVWPLRFAALRMGTGYKIEDLANQWHCSPDSVSKKAKEMKCLRYVEIDGNFVACVVHPETSRGK